ncbi:MAG: class I SAM-dependent methyltransferase [Thermoanaerobaculia bacterium]
MTGEAALAELRDLFGDPDVVLEPGVLRARGREYPVVDDVVILLDPEEYPGSLRERLGLGRPVGGGATTAIDTGIQFTFGEQWKKFPRTLPEYEAEFHRYFDLVDLPSLAGKRVCDLGCGMGRWSNFLAPRCRTLVLVDFSEAIFVAREGLRGEKNVLFFMGDIQRLPFRTGFADLVVSLGVLHHLPTDALGAVRRLRTLAPELLIYLYYALDNRPAYFGVLLAWATALRKVLSRIREPGARAVITRSIAALVYVPLVGLGWCLKPFGLANRVPLFEVYHTRSWEGICQDVYDRFFTGIEHRYSREQIRGLRDSFETVVISDGLPYWHFLCRSR